VRSHTFALLAGCSAPPAAHAGTVERFLEHDGLKRRYLVYVPAALEASAGRAP